MAIGAYMLMATLAIVAFACTFLPPMAGWLMIPIGLLMFDNTRRGLGISVIIAVPILVAVLLVIAKMVKNKQTTWLKSGTLTLELLGFAGIATCLFGLTLLRSGPWLTKQVQNSQPDYLSTQ